MKRQIKLGLLAVALTALLTGLGVPGWAQADVKVNVLAAEYNNNLLVVSVVAFATEGEDPTDWDVSLLSSGTPGSLVVQREEDLTFPRARLWKLVVKGDVVDPGDSLTAEVDLGDGTTAEDTAVCGRGLPRLHITAICK